MYWICIVITISIIAIMGIRWICAYKADHIFDKHFRWSRRESDFPEAGREAWEEYNERRKKWLEKQ
ncbi:hypothetical protein LCGC14_1226420 [marine sediment metagenome]|uniref:Uncharacterized protein n=1 Tax=marine sediment metagenome TaxID=412755 RepID=A0A0F9LDT7_9ZZZZ